jgi:hypothetical protein
VQVEVDAVLHHLTFVMVTGRRSVSLGQQDLRQRVADHAWWHTVELAPGVVTPGCLRLRGAASRASGFLLKDSGPAELLHAIRVVAAGEALLAPRITRRLIAQFASARTAHQVAEDWLAELTQRERQVLALVGRGSATRRSPRS